MVLSHDESMAAEDRPQLQRQLFFELKKRFPEVPDNVVSNLMQQNHFVRECCIDALGRESNKYLYSEPEGIGLDNLQIGTSNTPDRPSRSSSGSLDGSQSRRSNSSSSETRHGLGQANNGLGSSNTTPSSDIDIQSLYALYGSSSQNGPYTSRYSTIDTQGGAQWTTYPPPSASLAYQSGSAGHGAPGGGYPPQGQSSGPISMPPIGHTYPDYHPHPGVHPPTRHQSVWPPCHQTPTTPRGYHPGIRTPSPQHYQPHYPGGFDYPPQGLYTAAGSPNTGRPVYYSPPSAGSTSGGSYQSSLTYMPGVPGTVTSTSAHGSSNASTPTHSGFAVFSPSVAWTHHPVVATTPDSEKNPLTINGPPPPMDHRRGSEDSSYTQSLLLHQSARMEKLRGDLHNSYISSQRLEQEVGSMEQHAIERKNQQSSTFPTAEDVGKMRDENRRLLIDIQLMTREIDVVNNGQTPLGVLDPQEQNFYRNIGSTGQRGSIHTGAGGDNGGEELCWEAGAVRVPPVRPPPPQTTTTTTTQQMVACATGGSSNSPTDPEEGPGWNCSACTFLNHPLLDRCECCEMPRINPPTGGGDHR